MTLENRRLFTFMILGGLALGVIIILAVVFGGYLRTQVAPPAGTLAGKLKTDGLAVGEEYELLVNGNAANGGTFSARTTFTLKQPSSYGPYGPYGPGIATKLVCSGPDGGTVYNNVAVGSVMNLSAKLTREDTGAVIANATIHWSKRDELGGLAQQQSTTNQDGVAGNQITITQPGSHVINATHLSGSGPQGSQLASSCDIFINAVSAPYGP